MEDRYLFKAKRIDNEEWVIGYYIPIRDRAYIICNAETSCTDGENTDFYATKWYEVDPSTICQCTGLKDKNGEPIYENDFLLGYIDNFFPEDETRERVLWHENGWCTKELGSIDYEELDDFTSENFEVIGNKFDNPELLESEE